MHLLILTVPKGLFMQVPWLVHLDLDTIYKCLYTGTVQVAALDQVAKFINLFLGMRPCKHQLGMPQDDLVKQYPAKNEVLVVSGRRNAMHQTEKLTRRYGLKPG